MNKGFVLNNFINIDSELERLFYRASFKSQLLGLFLLIFNNDGSELTFSKKITRQAGFRFTEEDIAYRPDAFNESQKTMRLTDRIEVQFYWSERFYQCNLRLFLNDELSGHPIAELVLLTPEPLTFEMLSGEHQLWNSMEYLLFYLQMLIMSYEKIYLMVDVYSELLITKVHYLPHHLTNVANWSILLSNELKLSSAAQIELYFAALIHDNGMLFIPDEIANKDTPLSLEEYELIKIHPVRSAQIADAILYGLPIFDLIPKIIKHHHERYDGSGYPDGLAGEDIPYLSRVLQIADSVDAMLSYRAHKPTMTADEVVKELNSKSGILFDPDIAKVMIKILEEHKFMPSEALVDADFIPHASLSFFYKDIKTIKAFTGNIIISKQKGKFILHESEDHLHELSVRDIHKCTISFFKQNEFIEFNTDVYGILDDKLFLTNFVYLPPDKYFSLPWSSQADLFIDQASSVNVDIIKLGGNTIVLEASIDIGNAIINAPLGSLRVAINENINEITLDAHLPIRIVRYYKTGKSYILSCGFYDLHPSTSDLILKLLFRKQIELKLTKVQNKKNQ